MCKHRNGPSAGHGRAVLARAGRMLLDKDYGSRRGWTGSDGRSAWHPRCCRPGRANRHRRPPGPPGPRSPPDGCLRASGPEPLSRSLRRPPAPLPGPCRPPRPSSRFQLARGPSGQSDSEGRTRHPPRRPGRRPGAEGATQQSGSAQLGSHGYPSAGPASCIRSISRGGDSLESLSLGTLPRSSVSLSHPFRKKVSTCESM